MQPIKCSIIVADDDEGDRFLIQQAMEDNGIDAELHFVPDGEKLVEFLTDRVTKVVSPAPKPCLILLDLNMPRLDGREALKILKSDAALRRIPVVVLSSSKNPDDVAGSYDGGANSYFTKPLDYTGLVELVGLLKKYWLLEAELPGASTP